MGGNLERVSPDRRVRLERDRVLLVLLGSLLDIHAYWQPDAWLQILPPAIEVEVVVVIGLVRHVATCVGAVEAHNVAGVIVYPDAAGEAAIAETCFGVHVEDFTTHSAQECIANEDEVVMLLVEAAGVDEHHLQ